MEPPKSHSQGTERLASHHQEETLSGCIIFVAEGPNEDQGHYIRLEKGEAVIGSHDSCDLVLHDGAVSGKHLRFTVKSNGIAAHDLESTNGTLYLGQRLEKVLLHNGARLELGRCKIDILPICDSDAIELSTKESYGQLLGASVPMRRLYAMLEMLEKSDASVLIEGETGTGKELVAAAIHNHSKRKDKPFIILDCGNIPPELIESELFGHKKGSFTGAISDRVGAFEAANGGTIFLDELGELPLAMQSKLLRVLEAGQIKRIGEAQHIPVNVRVIAATLQNLPTYIEEGKFREDLFYRVAVIRLLIAPLRERREDIRLLAGHLAQNIDPTNESELPPAAMDFFLRYDWPGNVRELRNAVHRILTLGMAGLTQQPVLNKKAPATSADVAKQSVHTQAENAHSGLRYKEARQIVLEKFEKAYLADLLTQGQGSLSAVARLAGIDRRTLRSLLQKHGLYNTED